MIICLDVRYKTKSGSSSYIENLVPELLRLDTGNKYILLKYQDQTFEFEKDIDDYIITLNGSDIAYILWNTFVLPFKLKSHNVDIYHTLKNPGPIWSPTKNIYTMHSLTGDYHRKKGGEFPLSFKKYLYHAVYGNYFIKKTKRVIAISDFTYRYTIDAFGKDKDAVDLIYHGVDKRFVPLSKDKVKPVLEKYSLPENYILSVGNIFPVKNHISAVLAFSEISDRVNMNLVVVGGKDDPYFKEVYKTVRDKHLEKRVLFPGFIKNDDLVAVMNGAALLLFPSLTEGCPVTMLEAIKCGLPVIASKRGGLWDIGKQCALFVDDPMDYKGFAGEIMKVLSSEEVKADLRQKSLNRAKEFSWEKTALLTLATYAQCSE